MKFGNFNSVASIYFIGIFYITQAQRGAISRVQHSTPDDDQQQPREQRLRCLWRNCSLNVAKPHHQNMARELMAVAPCCAWSLLMCQSTLGAGRQKQKYDTLWVHTLRKKHVINPLCFPAVATCYTIIEVMSATSAQLERSIWLHTLARLSSSFETVHMCPKFCNKYIFFRVPQCLFLISKLRQTHFDGQWH